RGDLEGRLLDLRLAPAVVRGVKEREQRRRSGDQDALAGAVLEQPRVAVERRDVAGLVRDEADDELRRALELGVVGLGRELVEVRAQLGGVAVEMRLALLVALGLER